MQSLASLLADRVDKREARWATPGGLAQHINPKLVQTPALDLIDEALVWAFKTPDARLAISMPPQEGKSVRVAGDFPVWALTQNPDTRIVTASYAAPLAIRNGRAIRSRITDNPDLGLTIAKDNGAAGEWTLAGHEGGVFSIGVGGGVTGRPADMLIIDDPVKDLAEAESKTYRDRVWDWWQAASGARLAPGAPVIVIMTRWHQDDLVGRLIEADTEHEWRVLNIPAQADHRPELGGTDPLGREPGEFMLSARGRTQKQWERRKREAGPKTWAALYQGRPSPDEGGVFPRTDAWARYDQPMWTERPDGSRWVPGVGERDDHELIQSWDLTFKDAKGSDFVVGQVWLRVNGTVYLLDQVRARMNFTATLQAIRALTARWPQAGAKFIEDKANGPAVIASLQQTIPGIIPVEPVGSKYARASAIAPFVVSQNVVLPDAKLLPNVNDLFEEALNFPNSTHDDTVDAFSQAVNRLLLTPLLNGGSLVTPDDLFEDTHVSLSAY